MAGEALATTIKDPVNPPASKKRRNLPGTPDPEAEVIALSPKSLLATNRFICEICGKGFQRDQNLQLHRRGHNLPWKLRQRGGKEARKRVYVCPERGCVHHNPSRALGDLTGIKKHYCRKHGEKRWKCERCSKRYAVQSDWKAHMKTCGTREYRCDCGTVFSRRDSFVTHRAFCDALAEETARISAASNMSTLTSTSTNGSHQHCAPHPMMKHSGMVNPLMPLDPNAETLDEAAPSCLSLLMGQSPDFALLADPEQLYYHLGLINYGNRLNPNPNFTGSTASVPSMYSTQQQRLQSPGDMSATALLQKAAQIGVTCSDPSLVANCSWRSVGDGGDLMEIGGLTRDFLGVGVPTLCPPAHLHGWI